MITYSKNHFNLEGIYNLLLFPYKINNHYHLLGLNEFDDDHIIIQYDKFKFNYFYNVFYDLHCFLSDNGIKIKSDINLEIDYMRIMIRKDLRASPEFSRALIETIINLSEKNIDPALLHNTKIKKEILDGLNLFN